MNKIYHTLVDEPPLSPERNLLFAVIVKAIVDAKKNPKRETSRRARLFLTGEIGELRTICSFLDLDADKIIERYRGEAKGKLSNKRKI